MPKRSRKFRAVGTEANLLPALPTRTRDLSAAIDKSAPESVDQFTHEHKEGKPFSALLVEAVERVRSLTGADGAVIALIDSCGVICRASSGTAPVVGSRPQSYSGLTQECLETGKVVVCEDTEHDSRVDAAVAQGLRLRSAALAPIVVQGSVVGVIEVFAQKVSGFNSKQTADLLRMALLLGSVTPLQPQQNHSIAPILSRLAPEPFRPRSVGSPIGNGGPAIRIFALAAFMLVLVVLVMLSERHRHLTMNRMSRSSATALTSIRQEPDQSSVAFVHSLAANKSNTLTQRSDKETPVSQASTKPGPVDGPQLPASRKEPAGETDSEEPAAASGGAELTATLEPPPPQIVATSSTTELPILGVEPIIPAVMKVRGGSPYEFVLDRTFKGHSSWVTSVAFSADGQKLASGSWDQSVKFWDVRTGQQLSIVASKMQGVEALAFSRDGRWLAAENSNDAVTLWDGDTGREIRTFTANKPLGVLGNNWVYSIAFSPDGRWLASAADEKTMRVWDVKTGRAIRDLPASPRSVIYAAFSPDGHRLASGEDDKAISIWEISTGQRIQKLQGHKKPVYAVVFSPDGRVLASASADKTIKLWDLEKSTEIRTLVGHRSPVTSISFSPDGRWLASGSWDRTIKIWDVNTGREIQTLAGHQHSVYTVAFDSDGRRLASGSEDGTIKLWRLSARSDQDRLRPNLGDPNNE